MTRNLKALGLALVAVFAMSALVASAAQAEFTSGSDNTTVTASALNAQRFITGGGAAEVTCPEVSVDNTTVGTVQNEITAEPTYSGACKLKEGATEFEAQIDMNGCHYLFTTTASTNVHILCPEGKSILVTAKILGSFRECLAIHAQTPTVATVDYINGTNAATGKMDVEIKSTVEGITYERLGLCKKAEGNEKNDAVYLGNVTVTGDNAAKEAVDVTKSKLF